MFPVTKTSGDVLIDIAEALVVLLFAHLVRRYPARWLSEFRARLSASYRRKRIEFFTKALEQYESDFADGRLFMARIVYHAVCVILLGILFFSLFLLSQLAGIIYAIGCEFLNNCIEISKTSLLFQVELTSKLLLLCAMISGGFLGVLGGTLRDEIIPERYGSRAKERIARYSDRV